jgi:hypothetical protein
MLSSILLSLSSLIASALLGLLSITDMLGREAYSATLRHFRRTPQSEPDRAARRLAAAAR